MTAMLSTRDQGSLDLFLEQVLEDFATERRTRIETLNELQHFITAVDERNDTEVRRALTKAMARSRDA
jgi:hypothetical protein